MFNVNKPPVVNAAVLPVSPANRVQSGSRSPGKSIDIRGRILHIRNGRQRPRRYSPIPFAGTNRRQPRVQRRSGRGTDNSGDRVVTLLVPAGVMLDDLTGKEVFLKILG